MTEWPGFSMQASSLGALFALGSAFCWALAAVLFRQIGESMSAIAMNLCKGVVAFACLGVLLIGNGYTVIDHLSMTALVISGLIGIALGDTLYFLTLVRLGPRLTLLGGTLIPVVTAVLAALLLGERGSVLGWLGLGMTLAGVSYVLWERLPRDEQRYAWRSGLFFGLLFVAANAAAIILSKIGVSNMSAVQATFIRQFAALLGLAAWGVASGALLAWVRPLSNKALRRKMAIAAVIGAFLGTWLSIAALKYTDAGVASALNSTSPLFILPLTWFFLKESLTPGAVIGAVLAVSGIGIYFATL